MRLTAPVAQLDLAPHCLLRPWLRGGCRLPPFVRNWHDSFGRGRGTHRRSPVAWLGPIPGRPPPSRRCRACGAGSRGRSWELDPGDPTDGCLFGADAHWAWQSLLRSRAISDDDDGATYRNIRRTRNRPRGSEVDEPRSDETCARRASK